jgi:hypothetical protein
VSSFSEELTGQHYIEPRRFLFRGQGDANYKLVSSFDRSYANLDLTDRVRKYNRVSSHFFELYKKRLKKDASVEEMLSAAQHYGMPTRLLDWTSNPFVAAYFAFSGAALRNQMRGSVAIWAIDTKSKLIHTDLGLNIFPASGNDRADVQKGFFTNLTGLFDNLEAYVESSSEQPEPTLTRFIISVSEARRAFSYLNAVGFNSFTLFPDTFGLANGALEAEWLDEIDGPK